MIFSPSSDDDTTGEEVSLPYSIPQAQHHAPDPHDLSSKHNLDAHINLEEEEEDFQTVLWVDEHWTTKEIPDRPLCVHEHSLPHGLCPYPCPYVNYQTPYYETMDLSDISEFKDLMTTSNDEDIPVLKDRVY